MALMLMRIGLVCQRRIVSDSQPFEIGGVLSPALHARGISNAQNGQFSDWPFLVSEGFAVGIYRLRLL